MSREAVERLKALFAEILGVPAETVIVGSVPESYTYFSAAPEDMIDYGANILD